MFKKILFPTDFSESSKDVLKVIDKLDNECGSQSIVIVHIVDKHSVDAAANLEGFYSISLEHIRDEIRKEFTRQAEGFLNSIVDELFAQGYNRNKITTKVFFGEPAEEIIKIAETENIDCIVMGTRGRGKTAEFLLGSVSDKVIRKSKIPVLIIK